MTRDKTTHHSISRGCEITEMWNITVTVSGRAYSMGHSAAESVIIVPDSVNDQRRHIMPQQKRGFVSSEIAAISYH